MASTCSAVNGEVYDVFLSFRGADTRTNFTSHLYTALCMEGVNAFMDKNLSRGDEISSTLFQVIEASQISIAIFSPNYAASKFCLEELVKIMECKTSRGQIVFPVFHYVDPFEVEKQTGNYGIALSDHEFEFMGNLGQVQRWRSVLADAADLAGWDLRNRDEAEVIREIVQDVLQKLNHKKSTSPAELKERRPNEEKQKALRKVALRGIKNMTKVLPKGSKKQNNQLESSSCKKSAIQVIDDSMSQISEFCEFYSNGRNLWMR